MRTTMFKQFRNTLSTLAAAARAANAVDNGNAPRAVDLERLGIDPVAFRAVRR